MPRPLTVYMIGYSSAYSPSRITGSFLWNAVVPTLVTLAVTAAIATPGALARSGKGPPTRAASQQDDAGCRDCVSKAASLFASGHSLDAARLLESRQDRCPRNAQLHLLLSTILVRLGGRNEEALAAARRATAAAPGSVAAHLQLGLLLSAAENNTQAASELEKTIELDPSSYEAWSTLSNVYARLHEDDRAQDCATKAADLEPATKIMRLRVLKNLERAGKRAEASAELKRLIEGSDSSPEFMQQLAEEAMATGDWDDALIAAEKVSHSYPKAASPLKMVAMAQFNKHSYTDCLATTKKLLQMEPASADSLAMKGRALVKLDDAAGAEKDLQQALSCQSDLPLALLGMGELEFSRGNFAAASQGIMSAIDSDLSYSQVPEILFMLARAFDKQNDRANALTYYRKSLEKGLTGESAGETRSAIDRLSGALPAAGN